VGVGEQLAAGGGSGGRQTWMASDETAESCARVEAGRSECVRARSVLDNLLLMHKCDRVISVSEWLTLFCVSHADCRRSSC
jgi:hypothetical protein